MELCGRDCNGQVSLECTPKNSRAERQRVWAWVVPVLCGRAQARLAVPRAFLVNNLPATPGGISQVWQAKDLELRKTGSVAGKGVMGGYFGCVANKEVRDWRLEVGEEKRATSPTMFL